MHAELVMIGTELLLGEIVDTNANRLAKSLREIGLDLYYKTTVGDNGSRITEVLNLALKRSDVVITSGGLGPTVDDITRQAVADATGRKLVYSTELEAQIAARFGKFGRKMADNNKRQAYIPQGAIPLANPVGSAPCFLSEDVKGRGIVISLPGVPRELEYMMEKVVLPLLAERMGGRKVMKVRVLRTCAVGESNIDRTIGDLMTTANPTVGLAAHVGQTDIRIAAKADTEAGADALIAPVEAELRKRLGVAIYGEGKETLAEVLGKLLDERGLKLGVVDTFTGGWLTRNMSESGFGQLIATDLNPDTLDEALQTFELAQGDLPEVDSSVLGAEFAEAVAPENGIGLALLGPFEDNTTVIAIHGPGANRLVKSGQNRLRGSYMRRWMVAQAQDWVRRVLLGQLSSPADWG